MSSNPHFLRPLVTSSGPHVLRNERTGVTLARTLELASDSRTRTRGLLGRTGLAAGSVLIIAPCNAIHTFFMRFTIDVVFADRQGQVLKVCWGLKPWRIGVAMRAFAALEFEAGSVDRADITPGDRLAVLPGRQSH
jgi:uncharacterized protein